MPVRDEGQTRTIGRVMLKKLLLAAAICLAAVVAFMPRAAGTPEIAEEEKRSCVTCHTALGKAELNEAGEYYKEKRTLEGYPKELPPPAPAPDAINGTVRGQLEFPSPDYSSAL